MTTLTSAGAVNLTASTNWSPAQIPQAGDDLIIGAHTLTLDADLTLNSITLNNASSRLAISGTSRIVDCTNGYTINGINISAVLIGTAIPSGTSLTLRGTWYGAGGTSSLNGIATSTGGNLTLATIGDSASDVLFANLTGSAVGSSRVITSAWSAGTLTTIGRFDLASWTGSSTLVTMSGGTWNHTNTGTSLLGSGAHQIFMGSGTSAIAWSGDITSGSTSGNGLFVDGGSGASSFSGVQKRTGCSATANALGVNLSSVLSTNKLNTVTISGMMCVSVQSRAVSIIAYGASSSCRINWRNQSRTIPSTDAVVILNGNSSVIDMTGLILSNAGRFVYVESGSAQAVVDSSTLITNTTTSAQACVVSNSGALDGKVVNLSSDILRIPTANEVAADADPFGYTASPITPTGLVVDPAVIAAAVGTALESISAAALARFVSVNTGQTEAATGSVAKLAQGGTVDLSSVLDKLPVSGRALSDADYTPGGLTPEQETLLEDTKTATDSIATAIAGGSPVEPTGRIANGGTVTAYIGDDFRVRSGTALPIPVKDPAAGLKAKLDAIGPSNLFFGAAPKNGPVGAITGTISGITAAAGITTISVEISNCGADLMPGSMSYQIQQSVPQSSEFDDFVELEGTLLLKPRTVAPRS